MQEINLEFDKSITRLYGNPYGREVYEKQVKDKININENNVLVFPPQIIKVSSSFVQGFFTELVNEIGYEELERHITIKSENPKLKDSIWENLF